MGATEQEIIENLQQGHGLDLLDIYQHRTDCENCTRTDYDTDCPWILREYVIRRKEGLDVTYNRATSCKIKPDPFRQERIDYLLQELRIPREYQDKTINEYKAAVESQVKGKRICVEYVKNFAEAWDTGAGLVITGPTGTGKTHLAVGLAKGIIQQHLGLVRFVDVGVWASDFVYGSQSFEGKKSVIDKMKRAQLLILDDLGAEQDLTSKNTVVGALQLILKHRTNEALPTIITTNMPQRELQDYLGQRIWSRVYQKSDFIALIGNDYRGMGQYQDWQEVARA